MYKRIWFLLGILVGFLLTEIWRRKQLDDLRAAKITLDAIDAHSERNLKELEAYFAAKSTEEKIESAIYQALNTDEMEWGDDYEA